MHSHKGDAQRLAGGAGSSEVILVGNQRGGAGGLAAHLLNTHDNEHVEVHDVRGFVAETLHEALRESEALSRGTRCRQHLYSLSLNPPKDHNVRTDVFENAIERIENKLGLSGQPRAIVIHEKQGLDGETRRHAHAVWSRINVDEMKAVPVSYPKKKLRDISREIYLEQGWQMPRGFLNSAERSPMNFTHAEWQQARRNDQDPRNIKGAFRDAWAISDSKAAFEAALQARGFTLARGDRRGFVAVDAHGEVYSVARMAGVKTKEVRARLGDENALPGVTETRDAIAKPMMGKLKGFEGEHRDSARQEFKALKCEKADLIQRQRTERRDFIHTLETRSASEAAARQARFRTGVGGLWDRVTGAHTKTIQRNTREAQSHALRDRAAKDDFIFKQAEQRRAFTAKAQDRRASYISERSALRSDTERYAAMRAPEPESPTPPPPETAKDTYIQRRTRKPKPKPHPAGTPGALPHALPTKKERPLLKEDFERLQREADIAKAVRGPDYSRLEGEIRRNKVYAAKRAQAGAEDRARQGRKT
ncbi:MAG: hypothetical protein AAF869_08410, partial [Pseudomonadota bacterium]